MTIKEKLQIISSKIGMYEIRQQRAKATGDYHTYKTMRGAIYLAKKEFKRLSILYKKEKKV